MTTSNQAVWTTPSLVDWYGQRHGWSCDGERVALNSIADEVRGQAVLDIGVGAGRTTWLLRLLTDDYVAIDWSPEMVETCATLYPGTDVCQGDARDLSLFPTSHFKLVMFSFNGIDDIERSGRLRVYDEVKRVLRPDGIFVFSTLSKHGRFYRQRPWFRGPGFPTVRRIARQVLEARERLAKLPRRYTNWWKNRKACVDHGDWALGLASTLDFGLSYFSSPEGERKVLAEHGLFVSDMFSSTGQRVDDASPDFPWFLVVARPSVTEPVTPTVAEIQEALRLVFGQHGSGVGAATSE